MGALAKYLPCLPFLLIVIKSLKSACFVWFIGAIVQSPGGAEVLNGAESRDSAGLRLDGVKG